MATRSHADLSRGILFGAATGMAAMVVAAAVAIGIVGSPHVMPGWQWALMALPGLLIMGLILGLPISALTVFCAACVQRRWPAFGHPLVWSALGCALTAPAAWLVAFGGESLTIFGFVCGIGAVSGLAARFGAMGTFR